MKFRSLAVGVALFTLVGCAYFPTSGPATKDIERASNEAATNAIQVVDVNDVVARQLRALKTNPMFSDMLGDIVGITHQVGPGDVLEVSIWEAPPATLFGSGLIDARGAPNGARAVVLPDQVVSESGLISVPFAGQIKAAGKNLQAIEADITSRLVGKANQPQVLVRLSRNFSNIVTIVGEVTQSTRMPITPSRERLLDAIAAASGVRQPVNKTTIQVTRGSNVQSLPLDTIIRDPKQNVRLQGGDVVTAYFQPLSFTALGATVKNEEVSFEAQGISLAQALARVGGVQDNRADAKGVFVFRYERADAATLRQKPKMVTADGKVPVIYRLDLGNPASYLLMQDFPIENKDVLYVANAPAVELQKFLNVVFSVAYPLLTVCSAGLAGC